MKRLEMVCNNVQRLDHPLKPWMPEAIYRLEKLGKPYKASWSIEDGYSVVVVEADDDHEKELKKLPDKAAELATVPKAKLDILRARLDEKLKVKNV